MSVAEAIRDAAERLSRGTARLDAELLMAHALGTDRSSMLLRHMYDAAPAEFDRLVSRRAANEPVAYITGTQEFYGRKFRVTPDVLIPRSDSETIIDAALETAPNAERVLDCGTGSGALLITFLIESAAKEGVGIDCSAGALAVAQGNAQALGLNPPQAVFSRRNWHEAGWASDLGRFDLIIANPPYVESDAQLEPDVADFEPAGALFAGEDGLDDYQALIPQLGSLLRPCGKVVLEIGASQEHGVSEIALAEGFAVTLKRDLADRARALVLL